MYKATLFFNVSMLCICVCAFPQGNRRIYLGIGMDSLFVHEVMHPVEVDSSTVPAVMGCTRLFFDLTEPEQNDLTVNRAGVILPAKSTETNERNMRGVYTTGQDTCEAIYKAITERITNGRSAALSILNLFSRSENKVPQGPPVVSTDYMQLEGVMHSDHLEAPFRYVSDHRKNVFHTGGWLVLYGDTLKVDLATAQINRRGKIKYPRNPFNTGFLLVKGADIFAAVDGMHSQAVFYLHRGMNREEKLLITAFLMLTSDN
jgi:hypothetical protein